MPTILPMNTRRAQVEMTFHWIYVLLAGVVILLFFVGIAVKQKAASEQSLGTELSSILESIFTSASASESTKIALQTPGLAGETLFFNCQDDSGGQGAKSGQVTKYGIAGKGAPRVDAITPLFAPSSMQGAQIFLWSVPYDLPYKIADLFFVTSPQIKYVLIGQDPFIELFSKEAGIETESGPETESGTKSLFSLNYAQSSSLEEITVSAAGNVFYRIVDFTGEIAEGKELPPALQQLDDYKVTAVAFGQPAKDTAVFYHKKGKAWIKEGSSNLIYGGDFSGVRFAAIFSGSKEMFDCTMKKALRRGLRVTEVYLGKAAEILTAPQSKQGACPILLSGFGTILEKHKALLQSCLALYPETCPEAIASAQQVRDLNEQLRSDVCIPLY